MKREHHYQSKILWTGNRGSGTMDYRSYDRNFTISIEGKGPISGSSDSAFNGDQSLHNPEDLLVSSVASCHMLWYLHLCADNGIIVLEYEDEASASMEEEEDGSGRFTGIHLNPRITIQQNGNMELALALHDEAHRMCFIANTLNCPVLIQPSVKY